MLLKIGRHYIDPGRIALVTCERDDTYTIWVDGAPATLDDREGAVLLRWFHRFDGDPDRLSLVTDLTPQDGA